ncbi:hypothetical protein QYE76_029880 [Lolium multiflorum]|uniref:Reverse transcriptase domain-containing protein n=1 Tax=Lolium multiflorum TaxID=4521 RepID=A0AAD8QRA9_LOLMU|nr:hypothetical protein QYE76_029869 [Lolium multiflorum]KAK1606207.1 hypothetical protein QYE76_029880 [Lolium multiflorum]
MVPRGGLFRYEPAWALHARFRSSILAAWSSTFRSDPTARIVARLRLCRTKCKNWTRQTSPSVEREKDCRILIHLLDLLEEGRPLSPTENLLRSLTMDALHLSIKERSLCWRTRAKIRFALEGDENTKFFHASATCRRRRNSIPSLVVNDVATSDHLGKAAIPQEFFSDLLGSVSPTAWRFDLSSLYPNETPLAGCLCAPFSMDEVKKAVLSMNKNSSPGPDGFGPAFFSTFWDAISKDLLEMFSSFYDGTIDLTRINRAFLVLLPKIDAAVHPSQFRPISLQNCVMKTITKVLTTRLQNAIHSLVDADQTGFLSGRRISENIVYAADLLRCCHSRKAPTIVFKIDFRKAFDSVNWDSLLTILKARGFDDRWCLWMKSILDTGHTAILLNGVPGAWIRCRNGLRQGDPLSPYLFIIVADVLQRLIAHASSSDSLLHPLSSGAPCPVLQYVDDTLILCRDLGELSASPSFLEKIVADCLPLYRAITRATVVDGRSTSFWLDKWLDGEPLATRYPALFSHCTRLHASVATVVALGLDLRPRLSTVAEAEHASVRRIIDCTRLGVGHDGRAIDSPSAPRFCSREAYRALSPARPLDTSACVAWSLRIPTKVKIFMYLADIDRLSTRANLFYKHCAPSSGCAACSLPETGRHLFFDCPRAAVVWNRLDVPIPTGNFTLWDLAAPASTRLDTWRFALAAILWSIWKSRNDLVFNGVRHSTESTLRRAGDDIAVWRWRLRSADRAPLDSLRAFVLARAVM